MLKAAKEAAKEAARGLRGLFRAEGQEGIQTPADKAASFTLEFGDLKVGTLELRDGWWEFTYSDAFRNQLEQKGGVQPLVDFPSVHKTYRSQELWPFFMSRIPSLSQPRILAEIERRGLDQTSAADLLRAFGEWTIANPFRLHAA